MVFHPGKTARVRNQESNGAPSILNLGLLITIVIEKY